ncbi:hypothetical protein MMC11_008897, partial [Xylographa trunciseda]|nr:hypothetical protein [Xylographa trunciseda]
DFNGTVGLSQEKTICKHTHSVFLRLPDEILCMVFGQITDPRYLNALSRTCKRAHTLGQPFLFKHVTLRIPWIWNDNLGFMESLLEADTKTLACTEHLTIITIAPYWDLGDLDNFKAVTDSSKDQAISMDRQSINCCEYSSGGSPKVILEVFDVETANDERIINSNRELYEKLHDEVNPTGKSGRSTPRFSLRSFHLTGYTLLDPPAKIPLVITRHELLQDLRLESCAGVSQVLASLALVNNFRLKRFWLRQEEDTKSFRDSLEAFFASFLGLKHLSVLLDNATASLEPNDFLVDHYLTLKTLVWDCRRSPRKSIDRDDSTLPGDDTGFYISDITCGRRNNCEAMEELGSTLNWNIDFDQTQQCFECLEDFRNLRTLHIRNLPAVDEKTVRLMSLHDSYSGRGKRGGRRFMEILVENLYQQLFEAMSRCSKLEVIAIGASTIADRRIGKGLSRSEELDDFLKPRVFLFERFFNVGRDQTIQLKLIGEGITALQDAQYHSNYTSVLEPCWAR